jgi:hypothetical protein
MNGAALRPSYAEGAEERHRNARLMLADLAREEFIKRFERQLTFGEELLAR